MERFAWGRLRIRGVYRSYIKSNGPATFSASPVQLSSLILTSQSGNKSDSKKDRVKESSEQKSVSNGKTDPSNLPRKSIAEISSGRSSKKRASIKDKNKPPADSDEYLSFAEILKRKLFQQFLTQVQKKSEEHRAKLVSQLSEVFKIFDINRDGIIDESDLKFTFTSLGEMNVSEDKIKKMISESPKPIDFDAFVSLFEDKEMEFDSEMDLIKAFSKWDKKNSGFLDEEELRTDITSYGDRFTEKDTDRALEEAPVCDQNGKPTIDYIEFCSNLCGLQNITKTDVFHERCTRDSRKQ
ncbi:hypothetical protein TKK_0000720 [Trichogramma kaykai]